MNDEAHRYCGALLVFFERARDNHESRHLPITLRSAHTENGCLSSDVGYLSTREGRLYSWNQANENQEPVVYVNTPTSPCRNFHEVQRMNSQDAYI